MKSSIISTSIGGRGALILALAIFALRAPAAAAAAQSRRIFLAPRSMQCTAFRWLPFRPNPQAERESASFTRVKHPPARQCDRRRDGAADTARG